MAQQVYYDELPSSSTPVPLPRQKKHQRDAVVVVENTGAGSFIPGGWAAWLCIFIGIVLFIGFILAVVSISRSDHTQSVVSAEITQMRENIEAQSKHTTTKMVSMSDQKTTLLCALQSYYSEKGEAILKNDDSLTRVTQTIQEIREGDMKEYYYYHLSARLSLSLFKEDEKSFLSIGHSITSSFGRFSSITLEELEFNTVEQSLGPMRTTVLCTNNPFLDVQRCDASLTKRNILALQGSVRIPFVISAINATHQEQVVDLGDESTDSVQKKQRREVIGLRMYNLVFSQAEESSVPGSKDVNKTRTHGTGGLDTASSYKEKVILTLDLPQC